MAEDFRIDLPTILLPIVVGPTEIGGMIGLPAVAMQTGIIILTDLAPEVLHEEIKVLFAETKVRVLEVVVRRRHV